jgi:RNA polymerase sigma-70 factor (ECF subfamily)
VSLAQSAQPFPFAPGPLKVDEEWQYNRWLGRWRRQSPSLSRDSGAAGPEAVRAMPFDDSDQILVERVKAGDVRAFEMLHRRYHARIYRFAFLRLGNAEDAADVASTTFCKALSSLHSFQFGRTSSLYPWLHRIASNLVVDVVRAQPSGGMLSLDAQAAEDVDSFLEYLPADGPSPQELVERSEIQEVVRQAINQLPADQSKAIAMRFLGDLSIKEIAHALDRSEGAVKSLLHRALEGMRGHLKATVAASREAAPVVRQREKAESNVPEVVHLRPRDS